jgi:hypothetical protein
MSNLITEPSILWIPIRLRSEPLLILIIALAMAAATQGYIRFPAFKSAQEISDSDSIGAWAFTLSILNILFLFRLAWSRYTIWTHGIAPVFLSWLLLSGFSYLSVFISNASPSQGFILVLFLSQCLLTGLILFSQSWIQGEPDFNKVESLRKRILLDLQILFYVVTTESRVKFKDGILSNLDAIDSELSSLKKNIYIGDAQRAAAADMQKDAAKLSKDMKEIHISVLATHLLETNYGTFSADVSQRK